MVYEREIIVTIESQQKEERFGNSCFRPGKSELISQKMFFIFIFIVIFSIGIIAISRKRRTQKQPSPILKQGSCRSKIRQISSCQDMSRIQEKQKKINLQELSSDDDMSTSSSPRATNSSAMKMSCLCAPTNHPGSFRCRYHRNSVSVGSNLSNLANRKTVSVGANLSELGNTATKRPRRSKEI